MMNKIIYLIVFLYIEEYACIGVQKLFPDLKKQYNFILKSNIASGTVLSNDNSQWDMEWKLSITVHNYTSIRCQFTDIKTTVFNLDQTHPSIFPEDASAIKTPWEIQYQPLGTIYAVHLPSGEPIWASNIKRAVSLNLQMQTPEGMNAISYNVNEPCLHGICNVEYTCVDGKTVRKSHDIPTTESGLGRFSWQSVPVDSCAEGRGKPSFIGTAERVYKLDDNKGLIDFELRSVLQYHGKDEILAVTTELTMNFDNQTDAHSVENLDLVSQFPGYIPHFYKDPTNGRRAKTQEKLCSDTITILLKIAKGIDSEHIVRNSSMIHSLDLFELNNVMSQLEYVWLEKLYKELAVGTSYDLETCKNIFLEALPFVKTSSSALFVKYLLIEEKQRIEDSTILSIIRKLPFNIANYSQDLLDQMEIFTKLGPEYPEAIRHGSILSFATLAYETYRSGGCTSDYFENIVVKYFRMYTDCPQYLDKLVWQQGLSNLQVGSVFNYMAPKVLNTTINRHERFTGLLATTQAAATDSIVATVLSWPILTNEEEHIQLRIAALMQILSSDQTPGRLLAVHETILRSNNEQLKRFWYTTVKTLEKSNYNCFQPMSKYASYVSKLVTTQATRFWATGNFMLDFWNDEKDAAASFHLISIGDPLTGLPEVVNFNLRVSQAGTVTTNIGIMLKAEGISLGLFRRIHKVDSETLNMGKLVELLKKMKVQIVNPEKVHVELVVKIHDKTVYATHMNQSRFDAWNGNDFAQSIQDFLQFGTHINQQMISFPVQMDTNLATELGTPVTLQTAYASFSSIRGNLSAPFATHALTWKNDVHFRYQATVITSLSTFGPILPSHHTVMIQNSIVAHLPIQFDVTLSPATRAIKLSWPNPGTQNGGIATHSRTQVLVELPRHKYVHTVDGGDEKIADQSSVFFDCEHPLTGWDLLQGFLDTTKSKYDIFTKIGPLASTQTGSCGFIVPPNRPLQKSGDNVLEVDLAVSQLDYTMEENLEIGILHSITFRENIEDGDLYFKMYGEAKFEARRDRTISFISLSGEQPNSSDDDKKKWKICLENIDINHDAFDQDILTDPSAYEGNITVTYTGGEVPQLCPTNSTFFKLEYKGNTSGKSTERQLDVKISKDKNSLGIASKHHRLIEEDLPSAGNPGTNNTVLGALPKFTMPSHDLTSHTILGQLLQTFDVDPLNVSATIKVNNGLTSVRLEKGPILEFKSENFNWVIENWSNIQIMREFGLYRECRLQESTVHTLLGTVDRLPSLQCAASLALADCSPTPRFALLRVKGGGYKLYTGGNYVEIEPVKEGSPTVKVNDEAVEYTNGYSYPKNVSVYDFKITRAGESLKIHSRISGVIVYYKISELIILVPDFYLPVNCGSCVSQHYYRLC